MVIQLHACWHCGGASRALLGLLEEQSIGRTAAYRVIEVLKGLGLIETFNETSEGKRVLYTRLTEKGKEVGERLVEVESILTERV